MMSRCVRFFLLMWGLAPLMPYGAAASELYAEQITPQTASERVLTGTDAAGGIGDWYLANDVIEVIIEDPAARTGVVSFGGSLIDAGFRDRANEDQFVQLFPILNTDLRVPVRYDSIAAEVNEEEGWARITVWSEKGVTSIPRGSFTERLADVLVPNPADIRNVFVRTSYTVYPGESFVHLSTTIENASGTKAPIFSYADATLRGSRAMRAWIGHTLDPSKTIGFNHRKLDLGSTQGIQSSLTAMTYLVLPGVRQFAPISYGLFAPERTAQGKVQFGVSDFQVSAMAVFLADDWDELSLGRLLRGVRYSMPPRSEWTYDRVFVIAGHGDVASATDVMWPKLLDADAKAYADGSSGLTGSVVPADVVHSIVVTNAYDSTPVTQVSTHTAGDRAGTFQVTLPPGKYTLHVHAPQRETHVQEFVVPVDTIANIGTVRLPEPGWLVFPKPFTDGGPGRVIVEGIDGTPSPIFERELFDFTVDGERIPGGAETDQLYFIGTDADPQRVAVPPGRYRLTATRGFEHDIDQEIVEVTGPGDEARVRTFKPPRVLSVPDYLTADFHVHSEASEDSIVSNEMRVRMFVSDWIDVLTSTEHDNLGDFSPALEKLGLGERLKVITGAEVTGTGYSPNALWTTGHSNAWPIEYNALAHANNAPPSEEFSLAEIYEIMREDFAVDVIQLNHPRTQDGRRSDGNFFTHLGTVGEGFDPTRPMSQPPNDVLLETAPHGTRALDFDAIEVMNGTAFSAWLLTRADWYAFLRQGFHRTGTANSDTHNPDSLAAYPRTYVHFPAGLEGWDETFFNASLKRGNAFGTTGPLFREFSANEGSMGDTVSAPDGQVRVKIEVAAAPWVPVDEVRILVNGEVHTTRTGLPALAGAPIVRLNEIIDVQVAGDAVLTAEAGAPLPGPEGELAPLPGGLYNRIAPGFRSIAFTNPIYIDVDGNGRFDPITPTPQASRSTREIPLLVFAFVAVIMLVALWIAKSKQM